MLKILRRMWILLRVPVRKKVGKISLWLTAEHLLPLYKRKYPFYDSFLPILSTLLNKDDLVIDIGANIGDTTKSIWWENPALKFICIEPDNRYFRYLKHNTKGIAKENVKLIKSLISNSELNYDLVGSGGTKSMKKTSKGKFVSTKLDDLLMDNSLLKNLALIKTDTDGYDYEVLLSSQKIIQGFKPLIFSEISFVDINSFKNYCEAFKMLLNSGYINCFLFINTGPFHEKITLDNLENYLIQLLDSNKRLKHFEYLDILFTTSNNDEIAERAVNIFQR